MLTSYIAEFHDSAIFLLNIYQREMKKNQKKSLWIFTIASSIIASNVNKSNIDQKRWINNFCCHILCILIETNTSWLYIFLLKSIELYIFKKWYFIKYKLFLRWRGWIKIWHTVRTSVNVTLYPPSSTIKKQNEIIKSQINKK
jgi:hypothetical protein